MNAERFVEYLRRFNAQDPSAFDQFLTPDLLYVNGGLQFRGVEAMKAQYAGIWRSFAETVHALRIVSDDQSLAVLMWTHFDALRDDPDALIGPVRKGEIFDYRGVVMYKKAGEKFSEIHVAYNSFPHTDVAGKVTSLGMPH